ncbi:hypothetical protein CMUS01_05608 [Colletotrichum musicola]|uniref:Uncharacterized protein n=1 Tax=Colletotrichum musicola TaxID=2175873 RepID=A0A8H6NKJ4_9PEZI|nr:hypothetical protein CMUS01_05608 [Colletotrichum musicola]
MTRTRPIQKFAAAVSRCSPEASIYGKCIVADYNSVHKDKCLKEFLKLKDCYLVISPSPGSPYLRCLRRLASITSLTQLNTGGGSQVLVYKQSQYFQCNE